MNSNQAIVEGKNRLDFRHTELGMLAWYLDENVKKKKKKRKEKKKM